MLQQFRGNGMYDPDLTGVGVQPYYYDRFCNAGLYYWNSVRASKITIYPRTTTTADVAPQIKVYIIPTAGYTPTYHDPADLRQTKFCKMFSFSMNNQDEKGHAAMTHYCDSHKLFPLLEKDYSSFRTAWNASPVGVWYWNVYMDTSDWSAETSIAFDVKIKYYAELNQNDNENES